MMSKKRKANSYHPAKKAEMSVKRIAPVRKKKAKGSKFKQIAIWTVIAVSLAMVATMSIVIGLQG